MAHGRWLLPSDANDHAAQRGKAFFDSSFVQNAKQKTELAKAQVTRRDTVMLEFTGKSAILQLLEDREFIVEPVIRWKYFPLRAA